jgi:hypothetical protein
MNYNLNYYLFGGKIMKTSKNTNLKYLILAFSVFIGNTVTLFAQTEEIKVVAPYEPTISDAFKINFNPTINDSIVEVPDLIYIITPHRLNTSLQVEPINAAKMIGEPLTKLYKSYLKLGFGTYSTPLGEFSFNNLRSKNQSYGFRLKHLSSTGKMDTVADNSFNHNEAEVYGKQFIDKYIIFGGLNYNRKMVHYYGFNPETYKDTVKEKNIKQTYSLIGFNAGYSSNFEDSTKLNHFVKFSYYNLTDYNKTKESKFNINGGIEKQTKFLKLANSQMLLITANADIYRNKNNLITNAASAIGISPQISTYYNEFRITLGFNSALQVDTTNYFHFYPKVDVEAFLVKNIVVAYVGLTGGLERNSFKTLTDENPYIVSTIPTGFTNTRYKLYGGLKGAISSFATYNFNLNSSTIENMPFFINDSSSYLKNRFTVVYDDVQLINFNAQIASQIREKLKVLFRADFYKYTLDNELKPWEKPNVKITLGLNYNIKNKLIFTADLFAYNTMYAKTYTKGTNPDIEAKKLYGFVDFNFGVEYRYTKILSAFLTFNNIEGERYFRWNNYPSQRFNFMGGVTYAF